MIWRLRGWSRDDERWLGLMNWVGLDVVGMVDMGKGKGWDGDRMGTWEDVRWNLRWVENQQIIPILFSVGSLVSWIW